MSRNEGAQAVSVKGMVLVGGTTYRIERLGTGDYRAVRIADDAHVGTFRGHPRLCVLSTRIQVALMYEIARTAIRAAKTS
jgi:hypothetical protein